MKYNLIEENLGKMEGGPSIQERDYSTSTSLNDENSNQSGCAYLCCDPRGKVHRFIALIFMCFLGFGKVIFVFFNIRKQTNFGFVTV